MNLKHLSMIQRLSLCFAALLSLLDRKSVV